MDAPSATIDASAAICVAADRIRRDVVFGNSMTPQISSAAVIAAALSACAAPPSGEPVAMFSLPVTGQFGSVPAAGQATAFNNGIGRFWVQTPGGARCSGEYQVRDPSPALVVPGTCSDGKRGQIVITRTANLMSGSAIVRLSDGTRGQFVFGDLTYGQTFGAGGSARVR
jgi:hypothetical protein